MMLSDWMTEKNLDDGAVAELIEAQGVSCDRTQVSRYRRRLRRPDWPVIRALKKISKNRVTADDFIEIEAVG